MNRHRHFNRNGHRFGGGQSLDPFTHSQNHCMSQDSSQRFFSQPGVLEQDPFWQDESTMDGFGGDELDEFGT